MLNGISYKTTYPSFKANLTSPKLKCVQEDFFIKIKGYGKCKTWADEIIKTTDNAVNMIRKNETFEHILRKIADGVQSANLLSDSPTDLFKTGVLRTGRDGWEDRFYKGEAYTYYNNGRYSIYKKRLDEVAKNPLKAPYLNLGMSFTNTEDIIHGDSSCVNNSLDYVTTLFERTIPRFINGELTSKKLPEINDVIAEIRWVLAHATPWHRGSDSISNVLMRAMYQAVGVKTYPPREGISFDLEAYCTNLGDYKNKFSTYFEKPPEVIEE